MGLTRSRPYKKNDNAHVEQKNWTHVRQLLGYDRLGDAGLVSEINALYRECWEPLHNFYLPSAKLEQKSREGAKVKRKHDKPLTPCERLLQSEDVDEPTKQRLREQKAALNPFALHREIEERLRSMKTKPCPSRCHDFRVNVPSAPDPLRCHLFLRQQSGNKRSKGFLISRGWSERQSCRASLFLPQERREVEILTIKDVGVFTFEATAR